MKIKGAVGINNVIHKIVVFAAVLVFVLSGCQSSELSLTVPSVTGELNFSVLKAGQADAIIIQTENHCVIIDCGEKDDGDKVADYLTDNGIEKVDFLFITHFDKDHVGGVPEVLDSVEIGKIVTPSYEGTNSEYKKYIASISKHGITPVKLADDMSFILDDVLFEIYPPLKDSYKEGDNDFSLAVGITHGNNRFLFAGDAMEARLTEILSQIHGEYDFLKVPHHGRFNKLTEQFVKNVNPKYAVITCSEKNPAEGKTVSVLKNAGSKIYYTKDGNVFVISNGKQITVTQK